MPHANFLLMSSKYGFGANCSGTYFSGDEALTKHISKWGRGCISIISRKMSNNMQRIWKRRTFHLKPQGRKRLLAESLCGNNRTVKISVKSSIALNFQWGSFFQINFYCFSIMYRQKSAQIIVVQPQNYQEQPPRPGDSTEVPLLSVTPLIYPRGNNYLIYNIISVLPVFKFCMNIITQWLLLCLASFY